MKKRFLGSMLLGLGLVGFVRAEVDVTPFRLEETRTAALVEDKIGRTPAGLKLILSLKGPDVDSAVRYGNLHIDQAVDDLGSNLIPPKDAFNRSNKFRDYNNAFFRKSDLDRKETPPDPQVEIDLGLPKRAATKITRLRGWFELAQQGTIKTVEAADIAAPGTKKLAIPADAGVSVTTTVTPDDKNSIGLAITGDENAVDSIEVLDGSGKKVSTGMSSWSIGGGPAHKSLDLSSPLDGTMKLVVKLAVDRKITKVPFDLKDISLP